MKAKNKEKDISNHELKKQNIKLKSDLDGFKRLMVLLIILVLISVLSQGLYYYSLEYEKETNITNPVLNPEEKESVKEEELDIESEEVKALVKKVDVFNDQLESANFFGYFYKKDLYTLESISNKAKIFMALSNISFVDNKDLIDEKDNVMIPNHLVKEKIQELFGDNVTYFDEALVEDGNDCRMAYFGYDEKNKNYILNAYGHNQAAYSNFIQTKIDKAVKKEDTLEIEVLMYKVIPTKDGYTIYKDMNSEDKITSYRYTEDKNIFEEYKEDLQRYRYTFKLENDNYILTKIGKMK